MNETRDLMIGIDLGKDSSQLCYYDRKAEEPRSLPVKVGSSQYEVPTCLCRRVEQKDYCIGIEAEYFAREKGGFLVEDIYGISKSRKPVQVAGEEKQPWEILAYFLNGMLPLDPSICIDIFGCGLPPWGICLYWEYMKTVKGLASPLTTPGLGV